MITNLLTRFPAHTHPLTLVSDPDDVLDDEEIRVELEQRGFRVITERDPISLRHAVQQAQPFRADAPVIIITAGPVNALPYDLWQQGRHLSLDLHIIFPGLAYTALRLLSLAQRRRLSIALTNLAPSTTLAYSESLRYLLHVVFDADPPRLRTPGRLLTWLDDYHVRSDPMADDLAAQLVADLRSSPALAGWPLRELLSDSGAPLRLIRVAWAVFQQPTLRDRPAPPGDFVIALPFEHDHDLQALTGRLVANGSLPPASGTRHEQVLYAVPPLETALNVINGLLQAQLTRWEDWQAIAWNWADLTVQRYDPDRTHPAESLIRYGQRGPEIDAAFLTWLPANYAPLAARALPHPHHLHHIPGWLAYRRQQNPAMRPALLILDGMALADWVLIKATWQLRHPRWRFDERLVLAQIPSITAVSRQALVSGRRPTGFPDSLSHNRQEPHHWRAFWQDQGMPADAATHELLPAQATARYPDSITSRRTQALCLVSGAIDAKVHAETQGGAGMRAALDVWLRGDEHGAQSAIWIEGLIEHLLDFGYTVAITTDHGHVEALGMSLPRREGVTVETRSKRARIYSNADVATLVQEEFPTALIWHDDGLLPPDVHVLIPSDRRAFAQKDLPVVSHGGLSIEELVVPLVLLSRE